MTVQLCPRCKERLSNASRFFQKCGSPVDLLETVLEEKQEAADMLLNVFFDDHEVCSLVAEKLTELHKERFHAAIDKLVKR